MLTVKYTTCLGYSMVRMLKTVIAHIRRQYIWWSVGAALVILTPFACMVGAYYIVEPNASHVLNKNDPASVRAKQLEVGVVFGSGITKDGKPFPGLRGRLDTAAQAIQNGEVQKLLLTGDNSRPDYNEPAVMMSYLVNDKHIDKTKLQADYAGRSTYESCERAAKVFGLKRALLISAESHLPRAIYLCQAFGIESYGLASGVEANNAFRREAVARVKAILNVHVRGESTILGPPVKL